MSLALRDDDQWVDPEVSCERCDAVCCRLTVVVMSDDPVPRQYVEHSDSGPDVMARGEDGWCIALDPLRMCCSIYEQRPQICRKFAMGSAYCRDERAGYLQREHEDEDDGTIPLRLC